MDYVAISLGLIAALACGWFASPLMGASVAIGVAVAVGNFVLLRRLVLTMFRKQMQGGGGGAKVGVLLAVKLPVMLTLLWFLVNVVGVQGLGFAVGFAMVPLSFLVESLLWRAAPSSVETLSSPHERPR